MRLRHQALILVVGAACLGSGGCARLLQALFAPQQAVADTAGRVANTATAPVSSELNGVGREVDRLLAGQNANQAELQRIRQELDVRTLDRSRGPSAQGEAERLRPWHPRAPAEVQSLVRAPPGDEMHLGRVHVERGLAAPGPLPDGIAAAELPTPLDLTRVRVGPPR